MKKIIAFAAFAILSSGAMASADGEELFNKTCAGCHSAAIAPMLGAPAVHDAAAWAPRIANGIDAAVASAKAGKGAMPPSGGCTDCSDEQLKAAIEFMSK